MKLKLLRTILAAATAAVLLVGCGGSGSAVSGSLRSVVRAEVGYFAHNGAYTDDSVDLGAAGYPQAASALSNADATVELGSSDQTVEIDNGDGTQSAYLNGRAIAHCSGIAKTACATLAGS